jgi:predicted tellurium resistance membrane protein TerC
VLAVAGAAESAGAHSTAYAIAGIALSIPVIVFGATALMGVMNRFPIIVWLGGGLLGWVGAEMVISDNAMAGLVQSLHGTLGGYTHLSAKVAGFAAVILTVLIGKSLQKDAAEGKSAAA